MGRGGSLGELLLEVLTGGLLLYQLGPPAEQPPTAPPLSGVLILKVLALNSCCWRWEAGPGKQRHTCASCLWGLLNIPRYWELPHQKYPFCYLVNQNALYV